MTFQPSALMNVFALLATVPLDALAEQPVARTPRTYCSKATLIGRHLPRPISSAFQELFKTFKTKEDEF
jgi:hypothetical protein